MASSEVVIVGGGIMGCAIAWRLAGEGMGVTLVERERPGSGASSAAAGLLQPSAGREGGPPLLAHWRASLEAYPRFVAAVQEESGISVEFRSCGRLMLATTEPEVGALQRLLLLQQEASIRAEWWPAEQVRAAEPAVTPVAQGALFFPDHALVDNRRLVSALAVAATRRGVRLRSGQQVTGLLLAGDRVRGVDLAGERLEADVVVNAAGCWAGLLDRRFPLPIGPAKGQALALEALPSPFLRILSGAAGALSARGDGRVLFGSTMEEAGYDTRVTAGGVQHLLAASIALCPELAEARLLETWAGLRPKAPDLLPVVGPLVEGLFVASGHYQTGILSAPASSAALAGLIARGRSPLPIDAFSPQRFTTSGPGSR